MDKFNWFVVLLGAVGAIAAIFIKEIVQTALRRQILLGQLDAYTRHWVMQFVRNPSAFTVYKAVEEREKERGEVLSRGLEAYSKAMKDQDKARDEVRELIKEGMNKAAASEGGLLKDPNFLPLLGIGADTLAVYRQYLMDNRTFLSDSDAAHCGPAVASCVVNFRGSAFQAISALENLVKAAEKFNEKEHPGGFAVASTYLIDTLMLDGEQFLTYLIRLERILNQARQRNLLQHCWYILRGK